MRGSFALFLILETESSAKLATFPSTKPNASQTVRLVCCTCWFTFLDFWSLFSLAGGVGGGGDFEGSLICTKIILWSLWELYVWNIHHFYCISKNDVFRLTFYICSCHDVYNRPLPPKKSLAGACVHKLRISVDPNLPWRLLQKAFALLPLRSHSLKRLPDKFSKVNVSNVD